MVSQQMMHGHASHPPNMRPQAPSVEHDVLQTQPKYNMIHSPGEIKSIQYLLDKMREPKCHGLQDREHLHSHISNHIPISQNMHIDNNNPIITSPLQSTFGLRSDPMIESHHRSSHFQPNHTISTPNTNAYHLNMINASLEQKNTPFVKSNVSMTQYQAIKPKKRGRPKKNPDSSPSKPEGKFPTSSSSSSFTPQFLSAETKIVDQSMATSTNDELTNSALPNYQGELCGQYSHTSTSKSVNHLHNNERIKKPTCITLPVRLFLHN